MKNGENLGGKIWIPPKQTNKQTDRQHCPAWWVDFGTGNWVDMFVMAGPTKKTPQGAMPEHEAKHFEVRHFDSLTSQYVRAHTHTPKPGTH